MSEMDQSDEVTSWFITDKRVVDALKANGFTCENLIHELMQGATHCNPKWDMARIRKYHEEVRKAEDSSVWYNTDCPIQFGKQYALSDGTILQSWGTILTLAGDEPIHAGKSFTGQMNKLPRKE